MHPALPCRQCCERALFPTHPRRLPLRSWPARYRWRLGLDRAWAKGRRRLEHTLEGHHAWVNAVRLIPGKAEAGHKQLRPFRCVLAAPPLYTPVPLRLAGGAAAAPCSRCKAANHAPVSLPVPGVGVASGGSEGAVNLW